MSEGGGKSAAKLLGCSRRQYMLSSDRSGFEWAARTGRIGGGIGPEMVGRVGDEWRVELMEGRRRCCLIPRSGERLRRRRNRMARRNVNRKLTAVWSLYQEQRRGTPGRAFWSSGVRLGRRDHLGREVKRVGLSLSLPPSFLPFLSLA